MVTSRKRCLACIAREFERDRSFERDHEFLVMEGDELSPNRFGDPSRCRCFFSSIPGQIKHESANNHRGLPSVSTDLSGIYPLPPSTFGPLLMGSWVWPGFPPWSLRPMGNRVAASIAWEDNTLISTLEAYRQQSIGDDDFQSFLFTNPSISATTLPPLEHEQHQVAASTSRHRPTSSRSSPIPQGSYAPSKPSSLGLSPYLPRLDKDVPDLEKPMSPALDDSIRSTASARSDSVSSIPSAILNSRRLSALAEVFVPAAAAAANARNRYNV